MFRAICMYAFLSLVHANTERERERERERDREDIHSEHMYRHSLAHSLVRANYVHSLVRADYVHTHVLMILGIHVCMQAECTHNFILSGFLFF